MEISLGESTYLFHHVYLPPKLPQSDDYSADYKSLLINRIIEALQDFRNRVQDQDTESIDSVLAMMSRLRGIFHQDGVIKETELKNAFWDLGIKGGPGISQILYFFYARDQNAGMLMTAIDDAIQVESFELSPLNVAVMATPGRLQRSFPGPGLELDYATLEETGFRDALAYTIARMSRQCVAGTKPKVLHLLIATN